ncbi:MAG: sugar-binding protein [Sedimentisphaerales bacterium]|jgi:tetratricopeptide (TPR) repeat protein
MKALRGFTMGLLLAAMALTGSIAAAASTGELLQQGLYAEEVDGNLDAAIKTYEQVIRNGSAPRNHVAQALYRQGMCYLKTKDEQSAKTALEKLVTEYADQAEIVEKAKPVLEDLVNFDPAALMPPGTLIYVEFGSPGRQVETILNMLKGTPYENPLAAVGGQPPAGPNQPQTPTDWGGQKSPGDMMAAFLNPSMMAEFKKIRGLAIGITGIAQNNPPMVGVLYPGKSDALRGLILAGLSVAGKAGEPIEGMQTINIPNALAVAYDDKVILLAHPAEQLAWCVKQYKGITSEPTLASSNESFAKVSKKQRQNNAFTAWVNVDETYSRLLQMFPPGQVPKEILVANAFCDFSNIDYMVCSRSIEPNCFSDTTEVVFKEGHQCLAYDLIRTPNIDKAALKAVPSDAVVIASFALSASEMQADTIRAKVKNITGLDIGREIFANVEQVTVFAVPSRTPNPFFPAYMGLVVTSHNPQQTRQILAKIFATANTVLSGQATDGNDLTAGRYQVGMVKNNPIYCYVEQVDKATILSINPDVTRAAVAAIKDGNNVCNAGPLAGSVSKLPPTASKLVLVNAGGAIRLAGPAIRIESLNDEQRNKLNANIEQLARAAEHTTIEMRTDEQLNDLTVNSKLTGFPPLNQVFGSVTQIVQIIKEAKAEAKAEQLRKAAPATIVAATKPPVIDGNEDSVWSAARQYKIANVLYSPPASPNDLSAGYKAMWDQNNLYLLVDVNDDVLKHDAEEGYQNDSVEVFIDAKDSKSPQYGDTDYQYIFIWDKTTPVMQELKHNRSEGVQYALVTTDKGYRVEVKFPWSTLGTKPSVGAKIGLDVHVNDNDSGGKRKTKITWHDTQDNAWQNPQVLGNAELAGLVGWWKLDEKEGTTAADSSGNGNDGTLVGNPVWRPQGGKIGGAIEFSGKGDYVEIANESNFDITGQITISAWVNITSVPQEWTGIVTKGDSAWRLSTDFANNVFHFGLARESYLNGRTRVDSGQWHNVVCVYDGRKMSIYVDGNLDVSKPQTGPIATNDFPVCIGENIELTGHCWNGLIDDVRVYNYALSDSEIMALARPGEGAAAAKEGIATPNSSRTRPGGDTAGATKAVETPKRNRTAGK